MMESCLIFRIALQRHCYFSTTNYLMRKLFHCLLVLLVQSVKNIDRLETATFSFRILENCP